MSELWPEFSTESFGAISFLKSAKKSPSPRTRPGKRRYPPADPLTTPDLFSIVSRWPTERVSDEWIMVSDELVAESGVWVAEPDDLVAVSGEWVAEPDELVAVSGEWVAEPDDLVAVSGEWVAEQDELVAESGVLVVESGEWWEK